MSAVYVLQLKSWYTVDYALSVITSFILLLMLHLAAKFLTLSGHEKFLSFPLLSYFSSGRLYISTYICVHFGIIL